MIGTAALPLALVAALTGCGAHPAPDRGTISGTFVAVGGPVPVNGRPAPPLPLPGRIVAIASTGKRVQVVVGRSGTFRLSLPPGSYRLIGINPRFAASMPGMQCSAIHTERVTVGRVLSHVQVACALP